MTSPDRTGTDPLQDRIDRYAALVVRVGANVRPGQQVTVTADVAQRAIARAVVEAAYVAGASRVFMDYADQQVRRSALRHAPEEGLADVRPWELARYDEWAESGHVSIRLTGNPDPHAFDGIDPRRLAVNSTERLTRFRAAMNSGAVQWTVAAAPNEGWSRQVFGEPDLERLWQAVEVAMRLDAGDADAVVEEWRRHRDRLGARAQALTDLGLDAVRYHGEGTDLTVGLTDHPVWVGGSVPSRDGVEFMPNLPTEEVFTSPDRRRADGVLRTTRPLVMPSTGVLVEGLELRLAGGRIVEATAARGQEAVLAELDSDQGARSLGEVSLVEGSSRVAAAGVTFHDTLYDENTGCHVAWGQGFPSCVSGDDLSRDQLAERGLNFAPVHTDIVIGGPGIDVDGLHADGSVVPLIRDNSWAGPGA